MSGIRSWIVVNFFILTIFMYFLPSVLYSAQYKIVPSFSLRQSYDDNIYLFWRGEEDDFVTYIRPKIVASISTEKTSLDAEAQVNILRYADKTDLNTEEQLYRLGLRRLQTEKLQLSLNGRYTRDTTLESEWTETGIGLERNIRKNYAGDGSVSYYLTERDSISLSAFCTRSDYESRVYIDYWYAGEDLIYTHILSNEKISLNFRLGYNYFKTDTGRTHNVLAFAGIDYAFSETTKISGFMGLRYSDSKAKLTRYTIIYLFTYPIFIPYTEIRRTKEVGALLNIILTKQLENGSFSLGAERNITPSVIGEMIVRGRVYGSLNYRFSERWRGSISSSYYQGNSTGDRKILDYYSYDVRPAVRFHLTEDIWLELSYLRQFYKSKLSDFKADRNVVFLGINWSKIYLWQ